MLKCPRDLDFGSLSFAHVEEGGCSSSGTASGNEKISDSQSLRQPYIW